MTIRPWRTVAAFVIGVCCLALLGCEDDRAPEAPGEAELGVLVMDLAADPGAARDFFVGADSPATAEVSEAADLPDTGRVTYLVAERAYHSERVVEGVGTALVVATTEQLDSDEARSTARQILDQIVNAAGDPDGADGTVAPGLRAHLAEAVGRNIQTLYDGFARAASDELDWRTHRLRGFLVAVGHDPQSRAALARALTDEVRRQLDATVRDQDLDRTVEMVVVPFGHLMGALALGEFAMIEGEGGDDSFDRGEIFGDRHAETTAVVRQWLSGRTRDRELIVNLSNDAGAAFSAEFE